VLKKRGATGELKRRSVVGGGENAYLWTPQGAHMMNVVNILGFDVSNRT
jgi:hypothetical protein